MAEHLNPDRLADEIKPAVERHSDGSSTESAIHIDPETGETIESAKHYHPEGDLSHEVEVRTDLDSGEETARLTRHYWPGSVLARRDHIFIDRKTAETVELVEDFYPDGNRREIEETRCQPGADEDDASYHSRAWSADQILLREARHRFDAEADQDVFLEKENFPDGQLQSVSEIRIDRETGLAVKTLVENYWQGKLNNAEEESVNPETGKTVATRRDYWPSGNLRLETGEWTDYGENESVSWAHHYSETEVLTCGTTIRVDLETGERQVMPEDYIKAIAIQTTDQLAAGGRAGEP